MERARESPEEKKKKCPDENKVPGTWGIRVGGMNISGRRDYDFAGWPELLGFEWTRLLRLLNNDFFGGNLFPASCVRMLFLLFFIGVFIEPKFADTRQMCYFFFVGEASSSLSLCLQQERTRLRTSLLYFIFLFLFKIYVLHHQLNYSPLCMHTIIRIILQYSFS